MATTYPRIPAPPKDYDFTNESQFRTILDRFLRQLGQQAVLQDAGVGASGGGTPGSLVKWLSSSHLGTSTVSETTTLVTVANALRVTGITALAGNLSVTGIAQLLNSLNVSGATALGSTLSVAGVSTLTGNLVGAVDGVPSFGARGASRFGSAYLATRLWLGTAPTTTVIAGLDNGVGPNGQALSLHVPDQGFTGWEYAGSATNFVTTVTDSAQVSPGTSVINNNSSGTSLWNRCTNTLQDDNYNYSAVFYDCGFNVNPEEAGLYFLAPNSGTTYQLGEGLTISWEKHTSGNIIYYYRNSAGTVVDTSVVGFVGTTSARRLYLQVQVRGTTLSVYTWIGTTGTITPTLLGTVTMSAAANTALRDGAHQRVGVYMTYSVGGNPWSVNAITFTPTAGASQQADGFAAFVNRPLTTGSYADGGGLYIGNHGSSGLTQSEGLLIDDQSGSVGTSYALRTKRGPVQLGDATTLLTTLTVGGASTLNGAVTMASTLGVTGAITGSSTIQGTTITATTRFTAPLVGSTTNVDVVFDRNSVAQLTLGSLAATFAGTVQGTQLKSTIATGTAPLVVASTTVVANLHATNSDQLGGTVAASYALLASPTFTGTPAAPTAAPGTNTTQLATTAFVAAAAAALVTGVSSVFGRTGAVVAVAGDYGPTLGGTGQTSYTLGDTLYSSAANTLAKLAGNTTTTKQYLSQTGTGTVSAAPAWAQVAFADLSGALASSQLSGNYAFPGSVVVGTDPGGSAVLRLAADNTNGSFRAGGIGSIGPQTLDTTVLLSLWGKPGSGLFAHPSASASLQGMGIGFLAPKTASSATVSNYQGGTDGTGGAFTLGSLVTLYAFSPSLGAGTTITTVYGQRIDNQGLAGTTTSYGLFVNTQSGSTNTYAIYTAGTGMVSFGDNVDVRTVGKTLRIKSGANTKLGTAVLVAGTVTVANTAVTASSIIQLTRKVAGGAVGDLTYTVTAGTSFTITSASATDTSTVAYLILESF